MYSTKEDLGTLMVFSGNAHKQLAESICKELGKPLNEARVRTFADGEIDVQINESVRGCDCYIVQPTCTPVNQNLMEVLLMIDALKRASAGRITAVLPYYGYSRADRKYGPRVPIAAKLVANLISTAGADRVMAIDLHAGQLQGFFDVPVDHLQARPLFVNYFKSMNLENLVIISPDAGGSERARGFATRLNAGLVIVDKRRPKANEAVVFDVIGDVNNSSAVIFDDIVDTAGTLVAVSNAIKERGAKRIFAAGTHGILSADAIDKINKSPIEQLVITDTIPPKEGLGKKIIRLSMANLLAEAIRRNYCGLSISELFN